MRKIRRWRKKRRYLKLRYLLAFLFLILIAPFLIVGADLLKPLPPKTTITQRLDMFPQTNLHLDAPVTIYWNEHQVPYVHAETDADAAYALGMVHAHLRLGQMEMARRIVYGRLSEIAGPAANAVDHTLKVVNFPKSAQAVYESMSPASKKWMDRFTAGINTYITRMKEKPHEFKVFALNRELWHPEDIMAIGRLAGTDYTWLIWFTLAKYHESPKWERIWDIMLKAGSGEIYSEDTRRHLIARELNRMSLEEPDNKDLQVLIDIFNQVSKGSNSLVVGPGRTASGSSMIASDPHLGLALPNLWFVVGLKSPSYNVVGMMAPSIPVFGFGRNRHIAWGGTNLQAANSDLYDVSDLGKGEFFEHRETIYNRFWLPNEITYRTTRYGPVITDAPLMPSFGGRDIALKWTGHGMSDEVSAMLGVNKATNWLEFQQALETYAAPALNLLYADTEGNIGRMIATQLPKRPQGKPKDILSPRSEYESRWARIATSNELPSEFIPRKGYLVSANDVPPDGNIPIGYFFAPPDRSMRMSEMIEHFGTVDMQKLKQIQQDVFSTSSLIVRDKLVAKIAELDIERDAVFDAMQRWDGYYAEDSRGALAYQSFISGLAHALYKATDSMDELRALETSAYFDDFLMNKINETDDALLKNVFRDGLTKAAEYMEQYQVWGDVHRLEVEHVMSKIPVVGKRYMFDDVPAGGSRETIMKRAHGLVDDEPRGAFFGAQSRHISDLADPNANYFVLLGGQDGWLNSENFFDQVELWRKGEYMQVPLDVDKVKESFPYHITLSPSQ